MIIQIPVVERDRGTVQRQNYETVSSDWSTVVEFVLRRVVEDQGRLRGIEILRRADLDRHAAVAETTTVGAQTAARLEGERIVDCHAVLVAPHPDQFLRGKEFRQLFGGHR